MGVKEINLIAQDTTDYGMTWGLRMDFRFAGNLLAAAPDVPWFRILYAYPGYVTGPPD